MWLKKKRIVSQSAILPLKVNSKKAKNDRVHCPAGIYLLKVNNRNARTRSEIF